MCEQNCPTGIPKPQFHVCVNKIAPLEFLNPSVIGLVGMGCGVGMGLVCDPVFVHQLGGMGRACQKELGGVLEFCGFVDESAGMGRRCRKVIHPPDYYHVHSICGI